MYKKYTLKTTMLRQADRKYWNIIIYQLWESGVIAGFIITYRSEGKWQQKHKS